ncbi:hypothetical protein JJQ72_18835 [Paenibacillus sp. F411]|uniref:hypothetical protein n=1 Tax=Paenibacillus sp. F411 TaxID=2820239 RepID=UPI001AAEAA50|nr:hypothetical protein [Paenibacillus sp. F411]MBO2946039.1 hypothetical protein [Paenibacillus sp. F411]
MRRWVIFFTERLYQMVNWKWVAVAVLVFAGFIAWVLPRQASLSESASGSGESPDSSLWYTSADLYRIAEIYGEEGRAHYIEARFTFDVIWPLVYLGFLTIALTAAYVFLSSGSRWRAVNLLPLGGWGFDWLENLGSSLVMYRYPARTPVIAEMTPVFTLIKWCLIYASFGALVVGIVLSVLHRFRKKRS